jgi:hypothetical protein
MVDITRQKYSLKTGPQAGQGKYQVDNLTYPPNLFGGADSYAKSWVMININVQDRVSSGSANQPITELDENEKKRKLPYGMQELEPADGIGVGVAVGAGMALAAHLNAPKDFGPNKGKVALQKFMAGGATALPFLAIQALGQRKANRLKSAIQLPMPNQVITNYSANWDTSSTAMLELISRIPSLAMEAGADLAKGNVKDAFSKGADPLANFVLSTAQFAGAGGVSAATGLAANPKKELIFDSVDFRTFNLDYRFFPKSREEAVRLQNVIKELKYHMHPSYMSNTKFTFVYPSEFDITFYAKDGDENLFVNKIATCVLTNLTVNSTPDGIWAAHEEGSPQGVEVRMSFKELSLLTKDQIDIGY